MTWAGLVWVTLFGTMLLRDQPNNGGGNENCMVAWGNHDWTWADRSCDNGHYCLCKKTVG